MAKSMLAAIHDAQHLDPALNSPDGDETGASALSTEKEMTVAKNDDNPGTVAGISQADHDAAVATARTEASSEATQRLSAVLSADGIRGDGKRMAAALELAVKSPAMNAADVTAFVCANVAATGATAPSAAEHEAGRMAGADLAGPTGGDSEKSGLTTLVDGHLAKAK